MTASLYRKYNTFSDRESEQQHRTMTFAKLPNHPLLLTMVKCGRQPEGLGVAFFATGPGLGLIMFIFTTLEFPTHNFDFHLLTTSVNAKYY